MVGYGEAERREDSPYMVDGPQGGGLRKHPRLEIHG